MLDNRVVGPTFIGGNINETITQQAITSKLSIGKVGDHYFSRQLLVIDGNVSKLELLIIADQSMSQQFAHAYLYHLLLAITLVFLAISCGYLVRYKKLDIKN